MDMSAAATAFRPLHEPGHTVAPLLERFSAVRARTLDLARPLPAEDQVIQSMADVSPTKWHLAHTTWFFEEFVLAPHAPRYRRFHEAFGYLFNSYYDAVGARHPRAERGLISRPSLREVHLYRAHVDGAIRALLDRAEAQALVDLIELGLQHEQQHQELILMDIKHVLSRNPLRPAYLRSEHAAAGQAQELAWSTFSGGLQLVGASTKGFAFDNERPAHRVWLEPFRLASRAVTNGEYRAFIEDDGYRRPELWLADGWRVVTERGWRAPLYWSDDCRTQFSLAGEQPIAASEPVVHVSYFEADAFARWAGKRLPREAEWECAARAIDVSGNFMDARCYRPRAAPAGKLTQMFGDVWEWTASPYTAYPGFRATTGALGEYNGKFMCGQFVLRGGSALTPADHIRPTYRNFFPPDARWAFSGIRLAQDA